MKVAIFTRDKEEYTMLKDVLKNCVWENKLSLQADWFVDHIRLQEKYDMAVVSFDGAYGLETVVGIKECWKDIRVIWISQDKYFAASAMRYKVDDFIVRPISVTRFKEAVLWCFQSIYGHI